MKQPKFSETKIVNILKEAEVGIPVEELSRKHGFSQSALRGHRSGKPLIPAWSCSRWEARHPVSG
ncbi:MAG: transposase [Candidatus Atribacteria bacterium]|nr:transposase [Candidatus Atribacteria bacterium]